MQRHVPIYAGDTNQAEVRDNTRASRSRAAELVFTAMDNLLKRADLAIYEARCIRREVRQSFTEIRSEVARARRQVQLAHSENDHTALHIGGAAAIRAGTTSSGRGPPCRRHRAPNGLSP